MQNLRAAILLTVFFVLLTGIAFPMAIMGAGNVLFPAQANGSLITQNGKVVGSRLIGQTFTGPGYFHSRPSAAGDGYDAANSGGTNLGPTSDKLIHGIHDPKNPAGDFDGVGDLARKYRQENGNSADVKLPADAVTRSSSGLDPHISVRNAELQAPRVAKARGLSVDQVRQRIREATEAPFLGIYGDSSVNVVRLNMSLDGTR